MHKFTIGVGAGCEAASTPSPRSLQNLCPPACCGQLRLAPVRCVQKWCISLLASCGQHDQLCTRGSFPRMVPQVCFTLEHGQFYTGTEVTLVAPTPKLLPSVIRALLLVLIVLPWLCSDRQWRKCSSFSCNAAVLQDAPSVQGSTLHIRMQQGSDHAPRNANPRYRRANARAANPCLYRQAYCTHDFTERHPDAGVAHCDAHTTLANTSSLVGSQPSSTCQAPPNLWQY